MHHLENIDNRLPANSVEAVNYLNTELERLNKQKEALLTEKFYIAPAFNPKAEELLRQKRESDLISIKITRAETMIQYVESKLNDFNGKSL